MPAFLFSGDVAVRALGLQVGVPAKHIPTLVA